MDQTTKNIPAPARPPVAAVGGGVPKRLNLRGSYLASPRSHSINRGPTTPAASHRFEAAAAAPAGIRLRRRQAGSKEIVMRALAPPCQRPSLRWRNFRPRPSRFFVMPVA
ncbi:hypothetical protein ACP275_13G086800 [Erythranthe tilingii]